MTRAAQLAKAGSGGVLQVVNGSTGNMLSGTMGGSTNPASTSGTSFFTMSFTPYSATSKILVQTSPICIGEYVNDQNIFWLAAFYDTTRIGCTAGTHLYTSFSSNLNFGYYGLNAMVDSWGTTAKTVDFRVGSESTGVNMYVNYNHNSSMANAAIRCYFTIMEIAG